MPRLPLVVVAVAGILLGCAPAQTTPEPESKGPLRPVTFQRIKIRGFWKDQVKRLTEKWIPHCVRQMEQGGRGQELLNLVHTARALKGEPVGKFTGCPWSDAYVYNTIEAVCLALAVDPEGDAALAAAQDALRKKLEEWIPIVLAAQSEDGYIHSFHVVNRRPRYTKIRDHEFYVQGYFLEMGVAHYRITGGKDRRLFDAARKCADHLCATFGPPPKRNWIHGHAGMGLALCRLARLVDEIDGPGKGDRYVALAKYLFDHRHDDPKLRSAYMQSHRPVPEQREAVGHAVRATYFYTAMADLAMLTGDAAYRAAVDRIWDSAVNRKLYVTGGVGASHGGEAFDADYELRNNGYCESCAGCGQSFWADRMHRMHRRGHYRDVQERVLYNNVLGAIELSGENFFYQNPLSSKKARYPWHGCPCCVGNIPRTLLAIKDALYAVDAGRRALYVSHYVDSEGTIPDVAGVPLRIEQKTGYPWKGDVAIHLHPAFPAAFTLKLRIPDRAGSALYTTTPDLKGRFTITLNGKRLDAEAVDGYVAIARTWKAGDRVDLALPMAVQRVRADARVAADRGRIALQRGPIVFNVEDVDHGGDAGTIVLKPDAALKAVWKADLLGGVMAVACDAPKLLAIPNYARLNRGGWSQVWIVEDPDAVATEDRPAPLGQRKALAGRTLDQVLIGVPDSEKRHNLTGERTGSGDFRGQGWRHATDGGWFSYDLAVRPDAKHVLLCTYWGDDVGNRRFEVRVEGERVAEQTLNRTRPGKFFDVETPIPDALTRGKKKVTVRFQAKPGATAGGIFDLRILRPN